MQSLMPTNTSDIALIDNETFGIQMLSLVIWTSQKRIRYFLRSLDSSDVIYFPGDEIRVACRIKMKQLGQPMIEMTGLNEVNVTRRHHSQIRPKEPSVEHVGLNDSPAQIVGSSDPSTEVPVVEPF